MDLGTLTYRAQGSGTESSDVGTVDLSMNTRSRGASLALLWALAMTGYWTVDARLGAYRGKTESQYVTTVDEDVQSGIASTSRITPLAGTGMSFALTSRMALRLDYLVQGMKEKGLNSKYNVSQATAGLTWWFSFDAPSISACVRARFA